MTDFSQLEEAERPTDIPKLDLVRELSTVSARPDPKPDQIRTVFPSTESSADYNFHRRLNTLKDPEGFIYEIFQRILIKNFRIKEVG